MLIFLVPRFPYNGSMGNRGKHAAAGAIANHMCISFYRITDVEAVRRVFQFFVGHFNHLVFFRDIISIKLA